MRIVLASGNKGKLTEFNDVLTQCGVEVIPQSEFNVPEVEETGDTFLVNALLKANHAAQYTDLPVLADDSGLAVDALNGAPGIYSARYAGAHSTAAQKIEKLLTELIDAPDEKRSAHYHCALALVNYPGEENPITCEAQWPGFVLRKPLGEHGFGYDPIMFMPESDCAAAELSAEEKNRLSHRGQALIKLLTILKEKR